MTTSRRIPLLPDLPTARRAVAYVQSCESEPVANHSIRSYLFAVLSAEHEGLKTGADFDADLLFHACVLHDLGTSSSAPGRQRSEVEGADMAGDFLTEQGYRAREVDLVWEAIALHTSPGIAERRGALAHLTRRGVGADFEIGQHAPRFTIAGELTRERGLHGAPTTLEIAANAARWGA